MQSCWELWQYATEDQKNEALGRDNVVLGIIIGYGRGWVVPRPTLMSDLLKWHHWISGAEAAALTSNDQPKPWEPVPETIRRMIAGEAVDAEHGTWHVGGIMWEFRKGWHEPRKTGEHVKSEYGSTVEHLAHLPDQTAESGRAVERADDPTSPTPVPFDTEETMCVPGVLKEGPRELEEEMAAPTEESGEKFADDDIFSLHDETEPTDAELQKEEANG
jgi:hypothetical protein